MRTTLIASLLCCTIAAPAHAGDERSHAKPENTVEACSDHLDNDFDGLEDCDDPDCQDLTICANRTSGARSGGRTVAPPPSRVFYSRTASAERHSRAMNKVIGGSLMLAFSVMAIGIGAGLYAYGFTTTSDDSGRYYGGITGGTVFSLAGLALLGAGGAYLAIGSAELAQSVAPNREPVPVAQVPALRLAF